MNEQANRFNFTKETLAAVECKPSGRGDKSGRVYVYDTKVPGLAYCVTESGTRSYWVYRRINGKPKRVRLGAAHDFTIDQARRKAAETNSDIAQGIDPIEKRREAMKAAEAARIAAANAPTFGNLWTAYRFEYLEENAKPGTIREFERMYDTHLSGWATLELSEITPEKCEALKARVTTAGKYMANRVLELVSAMFRRHGRKFGLPKNYTPTADVEAYDEKPRDRVLSDEELARVFNAIDADENETVRDFFRMLICTGVRKNNVARMRWNDIHEEGKQRVWKIPGEVMKNGEPLKVALVPDAVVIIDRRAESNPPGSQFVFPAKHLTNEQIEAARKLKAEGKTTREIAEALRVSQSAAMDMINPAFTAKPDSSFGGSAKAWKRILDRAGVTGATIHDLRRTYCTNLIEAGVPLPIVAAIMGHKTTATTERAYMHVRQKTAAAAALAGFAKVMENVKAAQAETKSAAKAG